MTMAPLDAGRARITTMHDGPRQLQRHVRRHAGGCRLVETQVAYPPRSREQLVAPYTGLRRDDLEVALPKRAGVHPPVGGPELLRRDMRADVVEQVADCLQA